MCSHPSLFQRLIDRSCSESVKRAVTIWATWTLAICALSIAGCVAWRILRAGDVGTGAVSALGASTLPLAALAGVSYRKADNPPPGGAA